MSKPLLALALCIFVPSLAMAQGSKTISRSYTRALATTALKQHQGATKRTLGVMSVDGHYTSFTVMPKRVGERDSITVDTHVFSKGERGNRGTARARFEREGQI